MALAARAPLRLQRTDEAWQAPQRGKARVVMGNGRSDRTPNVGVGLGSYTVGNADVVRAVIARLAM